MLDGFAVMTVPCSSCKMAVGACLGQMYVYEAAERRGREGNSFIKHNN
jgi:hypothetical protein